MASIQATRLKKGMLIKMEQDLFRVLELQHVTPGNLRGFVRVKLRNIRSGSLSDQKLRSEDTLDRATLDERQMQYLYQDGDDYYFMDTESFEQVHISSEALGESVNYLKREMTISVEY
jgi:elongation factor P